MPFVHIYIYKSISRPDGYQTVRRVEIHAADQLGAWEATE